MLTQTIYQPAIVTVEKIIEETPTIKTFVLKPQGSFSFQTGQFIELTVPGVGEAPFTPSSDPRMTHKLEVTIMKAGRVTQHLHEIQPGVDLGLRGPYGKGYPLDKFVGKSVLIVGGGVGLAPLRSLILALFGRMRDFKNVVIRFGARSPQDIVYKDAVFEWGKRPDVNLVLSVDKGDPSWNGPVGVVTTILKDLPLDIPSSIAVVCGPPIMMKFATFKLLELGFAPENIYLSMEKNRSCGLGKCGHCRIGPYYACKDGPVFTYGMIKDLHDIWD
jgi:NAD(P)H-flavin reductase